MTWIDPLQAPTQILSFMDKSFDPVFQGACVSDLFHSYEPRQGHRLPHDPFNMIVGPRPIGWVSTRSASGGLNLAPYSFFNAFNYKPPIVGFSSVGYKDLVRNVEQTGEFAWNLVTRSLAEAMNQTSAPLPPEASEFDFAGLTPIESKLISTPRVAESPVSFECRCTQIIQLLTVEGEKVPTWLVLGEVSHGAYSSFATARMGFMTLPPLAMFCAAEDRVTTSP